MPKVSFEKPQPGNPHRLTIAQHVLPSASIARFAGRDGRVDLWSIKWKKSQRVSPTSERFTASRVWDQRSEAGYMKGIEDAFQNLATNIIDGTATRIDDARSKVFVDRFFALWTARVRFRMLSKRAQMQDVELRGVHAPLDGGWTLDEAEQLEKAGIVTSRTAEVSEIPALRKVIVPHRHLSGIIIQLQIDQTCMRLKNVQWGIVRAREGEFLVPDGPASSQPILPLTPSLCLVADSANRVASKDDVVFFNSMMVAGSSEYYIARDLDRCPLSIDGLSW